MTSDLAKLISHAIPPNSVRSDGSLTSPRTYGVFEIPSTSQVTRKYRFGNFPVRQAELTRDYGSCKILYLFTERSTAQSVADLLNRGPA